MCLLDGVVGLKLFIKFYCGSISNFCPFFKVTMIFLNPGLVAVPLPVLLVFAFTLIVLVFSTLTLYCVSTSFLISLTVADLSTKKMYFPNAPPAIAFSVIIGFFIKNLFAIFF